MERGNKDGSGKIRFMGGFITLRSVHKGPLRRSIQSQAPRPVLSQRRGVDKKLNPCLKSLFKFVTRWARCWQGLWPTRFTCRTRLGSSDGFELLRFGVECVLDFPLQRLGRWRSSWMRLPLLGLFGWLVCAYIAWGSLTNVGFLVLIWVDLDCFINLKAYLWEELH